MWRAATAVLLSLLYARFMHDLHENTLWFSNIKEVEREISFRTESGLYYSYYKELTRADDTISGLRALVEDKHTEFPRQINVLQRFNLFPEVFLALIYRFGIHLSTVFNESSVLSPYMAMISSYLGRISPILFYVNSCFFFSGLSVFFVFFLTYEVANGFIYALLTATWMLINYEDYIYIFRSISGNKSSMKMITFSTFLFAISWQFNQFILILQSLTLLAFVLLCPERNQSVEKIVISQSVGYVLVCVLQFFQSMTIFSPIFVLNALIIIICKKYSTFHILKSPLIFVSSVLITVAVNYVVKLLLGQVADTHINNFVLVKLGFPLEEVPFETALYICHVAFKFLGYDFVERTSKSGAFQFFLIALSAHLIYIVKHLIKKEPFDSPKNVFLTITTAVFGILTFTTMRMKYLFFPHMLIMAATAFKLPEKWFGGRIRFFKYFAIIALVASISRAHYNWYLKVMSHEQEFYDPDTVRLMEWINGQPDDVVFSGSMQLLAGVKCCTGRAITNHPHFEDKWLRDRTLRIYQIYGRRKLDDVYAILKAEGTTHIILEDSICLAKSDGCALKDLVDAANGHVTESGRFPFPSKKQASRAPEARFCDAVRKAKSSLFQQVFRNRTFRVYKLQ